jgi:hypothetical protein
MHEIFLPQITPEFCFIMYKFCQRSKTKFVEAINSLIALEDSNTVRNGCSAQSLKTYLV